MSQADRDKWEARYTTGPGYGGAPDPFFVEVGAAYLPRSGTAVDLAGGSGRHARWLAGHGLDTTIVDISPAGLDLAMAGAAEQGLRLTPRVHDLDEGVPAGRWDVILISFFLARPLLDELASALLPGGRLMLVHPTVRNLERHPRPGRRWLFEDGELTLVPGLHTLHLEEGWSERGRHEVRYVGQRR